MPRQVNKLHLGTAGIPNSTPRKTTVHGIVRVKELGLDAMEIEFVRGVWMTAESAREVRQVAEELGVLLTVHAPYYVNLNSSDRSKVEASVERILWSARMGFEAGAWSLVFHCGYYGGKPSYIAYTNVKEALRRVLSTLRDEGVDIWLRPEVMGGLSEIGSLEEVIKLSEELGDLVLPCVDFAHLHARTRGGYNTYEELRAVLELVEKVLGREALNNMHMHFSGIEYGDRGEIRHRNLMESSINYRDMVRVLKEFNVKGALISESPNLEDDALLIKAVYEAL